MHRTGATTPMLLRLLKSNVQAYTVHEAADSPADRDDRAEALVFVRDGFQIAAFILPPVWMLSKRIWWPAVAYVLAIAALTVFVHLIAVDERWISFGFLAIHLLVGFEADSIERWSLERRGYRLIASVTGTSYEECERRFFENWLERIPAVAASQFKPAGTPGGLNTLDERHAPPPYSGDVLPPKRTGWSTGLFGKR